MNIIYGNHQAMSLSRGKVTVLMTNNQIVFSDVVKSLSGYGDKLLNLVDDEFDSLELKPTIAWDTELFTEVNSLAKYENALIKKICNNLTVDEKKLLILKQQELLTAIQDTLFSVDLPMEVTLGDDFQKVYKFAKPHIISSENGTPYDIIENDLQVHLELADCKILALKNVANFLTSDQFADFLQEVKESNLSVFLLEFSEKERRSYYKNADVYWIDEDFVDWHL